MRTTGIKREKLCRTFGQKMMLRHERCASPKCAFTRRQTAPGAHGGKRRRRGRSSYGEQLREKQRVRILYGISEKNLKRSVREALGRTNVSPAARNTLDMIAERMEFRLDNVVYRSGLAPSRAVARHLVSHGHFFVNGRRTRVPSFRLRIGDEISLRAESRGSVPFIELPQQLRKQRLPAWINVDPEVLRSKIVGRPSREETTATLDLAKVLEFYAR